MILARFRRIICGCALLIAVAAATALSLAAADEPTPALNEKPVEMPPVIVTVTREKVSPVVKFFRNLDNLFQGPFLNLRSGPLPEAIVWRYHFLQTHPQETAIILVEQRGPRVLSATTVYTEDGRLYASSQVLGNGTRLRGFTAADIHDVAKVRREIRSRRASYLAAIVTSEDFDNLQRISTAGTHDPTALINAAAAAVQDPGEYRPTYSDFVAGARSGEVDMLGARMALAEETGDYSMLGHTLLAGGRNANDPNPPAVIHFNDFEGAPDAILRRTFEALHDPDRAGLLPVARSLIDPGAGLEGAGKAKPVDAVVFDWEGQHYMYNPDLGTYALPLPTNPLTRQPYLCIKNGDLFESINFCATYPKVHPGEKAALLAPPGGPYAAAYTQGGTLHLFSPFLGRTLIPEDLHIQVEDTASLARLHALLVGRERQQRAARGQTTNPNSIPGGLPGDDADMQMRRAYLALTAAGVFPELVAVKDAAGKALSPERYALTCRWQDTTYTYNIDGPITTSITVAHALEK